MARQRTYTQQLHDRDDEKALVDASWALRRFTDRHYPYGRGASFYAVCEVLERAARNVAEIQPANLRGGLVGLARCIQTDPQMRTGSHTAPAEQS